MWPFKRWREREKLRAVFRKYLADEVADELLNNPPPPHPHLQSESICFILLQVRDDPVTSVQEHMAKAMDIVMRRGGVIMHMMSSMMMVTFGLPLHEEPDRSSDQRAKSVARLMTELGSDIRVIYGTADGLVGTYGSQQRFNYGTLLPGFARYLNALLALEFGQSAEVAAT
jgi:hypothetical protein